MKPGICGNRRVKSGVGTTLAITDTVQTILQRDNTERRAGDLSPTTGTSSAQPAPSSINRGQNMNMRLTLHHVKNVDLMYGQGNGSGYWGYPRESGKASKKDVATLGEARTTLQSWITRNELGSGNLPTDCGNVEVDGRVVAHICFNGRITTPDQWPNAAEILVTA